MFLKNITQDNRVKEIYDELSNQDLNSIFIDIKDIDKLTIKNCELLLNKKFNKLYTYNKFHSFKKN